MKQQLDKIFSPETIAVIGASTKDHSVGHAVLKNLISGGFEGTVYPVNPHHRSVLGIRCYSQVKDIPEKVDLAIITTPARTVLSVVESCGKAKVGGLVIISAGFKEAGEEGEKMSGEILKTARKYGMRFLGTNCLGFIHPALKINASFAQKMAKPGKVAFISQSGALCTAILDWAEEKNVGFSHFVSGGSMQDIGFHDLIDYFGADRHTAAILVYMESLTDSRKFLSAARAFARTKPIILLKAGKSSEGAKSALSHTGSIAGNDDVFDAAFKRAGITRVDTIEQLFDVAQAIAMQPLPEQNRLAIVTNAGGPGVLATDFLMENGGALAQLTETTMTQLNELLSKNWSHNNPVDILGDGSAEQYRKAVEIVLADPQVDGVLAIFVPQAITSAEDVAFRLVEAAKSSHKTVLASWMGERDTKAARDILENGNVPVYQFPESAVYAFLKMYHYARNLRLLYETPSNTPLEFTPDIRATRALIQKVLDDKRLVFNEIEAKQLMRYYDIPTTHSQLAADPEEVKKVAGKIGFPLVMKIASPDITHKTDVGGVKLKIQSLEEAEAAFFEIMKNVKKNSPKAKIEGVLMEEMVSKRYEILIGAKKDPIFGPIVVFGMGGVATEIFKDHNIGLPPLNMALAERVIEETKIFELLKGFRKVPAVDLKAIQFLLYKFAYLLMEFPEIREIDLNPFVVDETGGMVIDANIVLDGELAGKKIKPYSHLVISPYPKQYCKTISLKDGRTVMLRPIRPEDEPLEAELFSNLSKESIYFRFFGYVPKVTHELLTRFTQIDYDREMAIVAELEEGGHKKFAGVVRLVSETLNNTAEFAIVVADPWQGQGLGNEMMDFALSIARDWKLEKVFANVMKSNRLMLHMFKRRGFHISSADHETAYAEITLSQPEPAAVQS